MVRGDVLLQLKLFTLKISQQPSRQDWWREATCHLWDAALPSSSARPHRWWQQNAAKTLHAAQRGAHHLLWHHLIFIRINVNLSVLKHYSVIIHFHFIIKWVLNGRNLHLDTVNPLKPLLHQMPRQIIKYSPDNKNYPSAPITACQAFTIISLYWINLKIFLLTTPEVSVWVSFIDP